MKFSLENNQFDNGYTRVASRLTYITMANGVSMTPVLFKSNTTDDMFTGIHVISKLKDGTEISRYIECEKVGDDEKIEYIVDSWN